MTRIVKLCEATHNLGIQAVWWRDLDRNEVLVEWLTASGGRPLRTTHRRTFAFTWDSEALTRIRGYGWTITRLVPGCPKRKVV